jgi:hypothetical protein
MGHVKELKKAGCQGRCFKRNRLPGVRNAERRKKGESGGQLCGEVQGLGGCCRKGDTGKRMRDKR